MVNQVYFFRYYVDCCYTMVLRKKCSNAKTDVACTRYGELQIVISSDNTVDLNDLVV